MASKKQVAAWLAERGLTFTEMTDAQKWEMRQAVNVCGAATSSSNYKAPCPKPPMSNGRCRTHGGAAKRGMAHPNYGPGTYSRYAPTKWVDAIAAANSDAQLSSLKRDIELIEGPINELLKKLDTGTGNDADQAKVIGSARALLEAIQDRDQARMARILPELHEQLEAGALETGVVEELQEWIDLRRQLVGEESKREQRLQTMISAEEAMRQFGALAIAVKQNVRRLVDRRLLEEDNASELLDGISEDFIRIIGVTASPGLKAGVEED